MDDEIREITYAPDAVRQAYEMRKQAETVGHQPAEGNGISSLLAHLARHDAPWLISRQCVLACGGKRFHFWETAPDETTVIVLYHIKEDGKTRRRWGPWKIFGSPIEKIVDMYKDMLRREDGRPIQGRLEVG
jgi:hypothetical protein